MDINKLLQGVDCTCGRHHTCSIDYVYIENNAFARLEHICKSYSRILLVADENTYSAAGKQTENVLRNKDVSKIIFTGSQVLVPDENAISKVTQSLCNTDLIIGIGSGVIQDLCKYVSFYNNIPYIIVATAPSMDGYASNGAAMITDGMKVTYPAGLPVAIIADVTVLADAPIDMLKAGYGDVVGKLSALNDWKLSHIVNCEYFCNYIYNLTYEQVKKTLSLAEGILDRDEQSIKALMEALVVIGILMSFAGSSRPASGSEHHLSHFFEITGIISKEKYLPHGIDVAFSTVVTAKIRESITKSAFPHNIYRPSEEQYRSDMQEIYGEVAQGCIELQNKVGNYSADRTQCYLLKEEEIKSVLSQMPNSSEIRQMLSLVDLDMEYFYEFYGNEKIKKAIKYAKDLKDRYTVLWLYYDLFGDKEDVQ